MKRPEKVGTRRLTDRSLMAAWNDARHNLQVGPFNRSEPMATTRKRMRAIEHHAVLANQRDVFALIVKHIGRPAALLIARDWTIPNRK